MSACEDAVVKFALLALLASGCTIVDMNRPPPADWPELRVIEQRASFLDLQRVCNPGTPLAISLLIGVIQSCAWIYFDRGECVIWSTEDASPEVLEHERAHCAGYDHIAGSTLAEGWTSWKRAR
jgi:hypothetical protein